MILPAVLVASFDNAIPAEALISASTMVPFAIIVLVTEPVSEVVTNVEVSSAHVSAAVFLRTPEVPARPAIAVRSPSSG